MNHTDLTEALRGERQHRGMRVRQLATTVGVSGPCVSSWESGSRTPPADRLIAWADALGFDLQLVKRGPTDAAA